jgi:hypothetical protein
MRMRLEDCICWWETEPFREETDLEEEGGYRFRIMRDIKHVLNLDCGVHNWLLLTPPLQGLPKVSSISVEAVPMANRPGSKEDSADG